MKTEKNVTAGTAEGKWCRGRQRENMLGEITKWLDLDFRTDNIMY